MKGNWGVNPVPKNPISQVEPGKSALSEGVILANQKRFVEAETAFRREIELAPFSAVAWNNLAVLQISLKQEAEAERSCRKALALDPGFQGTYLNLGYLLLRQGRYEEGWRCLEARQVYQPLEKSLPCPRWRGEPLAGCSLLIGFEEGYGDMIQLCRYVTVVNAQGAVNITMVCQPALKALLTTVSGINDVFASDETFPPRRFDFWTMPVSLPFHCRTRIDSIPSRIPYLHADMHLVERWSNILAAESLPTEFRVGLVWKGNPLHDNDRDRSLPGLQTLDLLGTIPGVRFFSLMKGESEAAEPPATFPVVDLGPGISDFADCAAIVANLDLVISVDTAIAHLAGALGKSCWVLLPDFKTDWRWLTGRSDSPWYPGVMRLFRQQRMGEWAPVIDEVRQALLKVLAGNDPYNSLRLKS